MAWKGFLVGAVVGVLVFGTAREYAREREEVGFLDGYRSATDNFMAICDQENAIGLKGEDYLCIPVKDALEILKNQQSSPRPYGLVPRYRS